MAENENMDTLNTEETADTAASTEETVAAEGSEGKLKGADKKRLKKAEAELAEANKKLDALEAELADRRLLIYKSGSIAEAALKLNGVFEAAEAAAQEDLENIRRISEEKTQEAAGASGDGR